MTEPRYHHGNLRPALLDAGLALARAGGPARLQIPELAAAPRGSPAAVYPAFPDLAHLRADVARLAREALAGEMLGAADAVPTTVAPPERAVRRFRAVGGAYLTFAAREPHLFETAFSAMDAEPSCPDAPSAWDVLRDALLALVHTGAMAPDRLADAPIVAWSMVHGAASIVVRGLLPDAMSADVVRTAALDGVLRALDIDVLVQDETPPVVPAGAVPSAEAPDH